MPIYAYRCASCGHAKDVLQKLSDPPLTVCPSCGASAFAKQVTAAGFQLKGSGWYATDFKSGNGAKKPDTGEDGKIDAGKIDAGKSEAGKSETGASAESSAPAKSGEAGTPAKAADSGSTSTSGGSTPSGGSGAPKPAGGAGSAG
ncbi:MAG TPA: zinc ribbon domain-containing protein [Burkholderiaceae bacterium]